MLLRKILSGFALCFIAFSTSAAEIAIPLPGGKPSQAEFVLAAKRALFSRNYEIWSVAPDIVVGRYKKRVQIAVILTDSSVILRNVEDTGGTTQTISKYLINLRRDLTYELAAYALAPASPGNTAELQAMVASAQAPKAEPASAGAQYLISGRYQSQVTVSGNYAFKRSAHRNMIVTFKQDGNKVTGYNESAGLEIYGTIEGDEIRFRTSQSDVSDNELKGKWKINEDGKRLTGKWWFSHGDGDWNLSKI